MNFSNRNRRYRNRLLVSTAMAGATLLGFGQSADAACAPAVSPNYVCSGANTTGQIVPTTISLPLDLGDFIALALAPANPSVTTDPGFSANTSDPFALGILGSGAVSYTDSNASPLTSTTGIGLGVVSLVPQAGSPYYGPNPGGAVTVDTGGAVTGALIGLAAINTGDGATTVEATGDVTATGAGGYALFVYSQGSVATVTTGKVSGKKSGIYAVNQGTTADLSVTANGDVIGGTLYGIYAVNGGPQFDVVNTILNGKVTFIPGPPASAGKDLTVTANGKVDSGNTGIFVENYGTGATSITTKGAVTAAGLYGIYAFSGGTDLTIDAVAVSGVVYGIYADNKGTGSTSVTAKAAVTGTNDTGIYAFNDDTTTGGLTVDAMTVSGGLNGIYAENRGAGATSVTAKGAVTGTGRTGIMAVNAAITFNPDGTFASVANTNATDLTVDTMAVSGGKTGIYALNTGTGATSITAAGAVTGTDDFGINAFNSSMATGLTVNATAVSGGSTGIYARNFGTGATSIMATGPVAGTDGDGINAHNDSTAKDLTVDATAVSGGVIGIDVINYGTGATWVKATGAVTGTTNYGIYAINGSLTTGGLRVDAAAVSGSIYGIYTENSGGATTSITATGTVEGSNAAIIAQSSVAQAIGINLSGTTRNSAQTVTALAVLTVGGSTTLINDGTLTGRVDLRGLDDMVTNNAIWTTGGTSLFGAGNDSVVNGASATLTTASNGGMIEATTFDGLEQLTSSGRLTMQDGGAGDRTELAGTVTLAAGSTYAIDIGATLQSDLLHTTGAATITGSTLAVTAQGMAVGRYTVLTADLGLNGQFAAVTGVTSTAFLSMTDTYDLHNAYLDVLKVGNFADAGLTSNQIATGQGLDSIPQSGPLFDAVAGLATDAEARDAFDQLSGEVHASAKGMLVEDSRFVRDAATNRISAAFGDVGTAALPVMAYGEGGPEMVAADTDRFAVWGRAFGSWGNTDSDGNAAAFDRSTGGLLAGADTLVGGWRVGLLGGYSRSSFDADDRNSSGKSDNYHLGLYGGTNWGAIAFRTGAAYSWSSLSTKRAIAFDGFADALSADYDAGTAQIFGELAYKADAGRFKFEPFANLAYVSVHTDGFTETGGDAALTSAGSTTDATFTTLGLRGSTDFALGGINATARGMLGWRHAFGDITPASSFAFAGGDAFTIAGVPIARDAAVIEAGLDLKMSANATLGLSYTGQFGGGGVDQGAKVDLGIKF